MAPREESLSPLDSFLAPVTPSVRATFTPEQLASLQYTVERRSWRRHTLDIRLSIPVLWFGRFYLVLVGGKDRRMRPRPTSTPIWTPINLLVIGGVTATGCLALLSFTWLIQLDFNFSHLEAYPVVVPFKQDRQAC